MRLTKENEARARATIALYPQARSAMLPLLHLVQEQDGYLTKDGMAHVAELLGLTAVEVYGTASFYDMFFTHPVGTYLVSVCTNIACLLNGGYELLEHAEERLGVQAGATTDDGTFTLEEVECIGLCGNAPCLTVNWRFFGDVTEDGFDTIVDDLAAGRMAETVPPHGTLSRVRRSVGLLAAGPVGDAAAPPIEQGAASTSDAPQPVAAGTHDQPASKRSAKKAAKQVSETKKKPGSDSAPERGAGERQ
ncbi:MAG TPA: NAD(P)H-dependent oxidoreductase subunit E [Acidimicrobiales bacterium]|nr:NAD(P)H-dependent oxidoreductase subunit E [Acidimicrobiales bacterium]